MALVIFGNPGTGKTCLLQHLYNKAINDYVESTIPLYIDVSIFREFGEFAALAFWFQIYQGLYVAIYDEYSSKTWSQITEGDAEKAIIDFYFEITRNIATVDRRLIILIDNFDA